MIRAMSRSGGRWGRRLLVALLVLVLLVGAVTAWLLARVPRDELPRLTAGGLLVAPEAAGTWTVGSVRVDLDEQGLRMVDTARDDLVVWQSSPGRAFVLAVDGPVTWAEYRGYFWPSVRPRCVLAEQQIRSATDDSGRLEISGLVTGCRQSREFFVTVQPGDTDGDVRVELFARDVDAVALVSGRSDGAAVHGFGEQFAPFDLSGRTVPIVVREQGVGRGEQPITTLADVTANGAGGTTAMTYAAWASFVTADVRGVELDPGEASSHAFAVADTHDPDTVVLASWQPTLTATLTAAADPLGLAQRRGRGIDRPGLPDWVLQGAVLGMQGGTDAVRTAVDDLQQAGAQLSAVWLQDWSGRRTTDFGDRLWWTWQLDRQRYPDWEDLVADLAAQGIRTLTYVNPFLTDAEPKGDSSIRNLYQEAAAAGYLVLAPDGGPYRLDQGGFDASLVDLTNPQARDWYADVIADEVLGAGADGFMADFGEGLPFDAVLAAGDPALEHNRWPALWASTVRDACERADRPDCVTWFRSGSGGMAEHAPLFWSGDQLVTYGAEDGMASALLGAFSAGVSGWPLVHSDVGGYTSVDARVTDYVRPPELNQRWAEMEAFGVVMRTHEGNRPAANAQVYDTDESRRAYARMTRLYAALAPYRAEVVAEATRTGVPALRHGWLVHPGTAAATADRQFFFGPSVLVAPVMAEGATDVQVTFPPGTWVHLLTGETYPGDQTTTVPAPLGTPAAFVAVDDPRLDALRAMVAGVDR
jgi:alpha-glucosidase